ncbi:Predicted dienelactone hydrolase [Litoreibacter ascidiaceicola]|uniref:Predicted dienelactone hydrolase n=1 Tax=Litoreibacter ascidiaceicola TaxID=1486859 RepID=A0A1M5B756_9RHOB|nr:hypothetical protein [Litoreibacter ascidiaceicola]SHF38250.1 Predicted dienelactone hydrolase [Litoreibacter ascidiaceicola]
MKHITLLAALSLAPSVAFAETNIGMADFTYEAAHHGKPVSSVIWYPSSEGGTITRAAENAVFYGVDARQDGPLSEGGKLPVVLLSHGLGGNWRSLAWLAEDLASQGALVISVNHPASSTFDFDMGEGLKHWTRARDMSRALDKLMDDPTFSGRIDTSRIMAAGFSYGGWTALSLGGVTGNLAGEIAECDVQGDASSHCGDLKKAGVSFGDLKADMWDASYKDARITHVAAMDPALHHGFKQANVADLTADTVLIALGEGADRLVATDFDASGFVDLLPDAKVLRIAPAFHFSLLPLCKPAGAEILKEEKDDPVCTDPEGADRAQIHAAVIEALSKQLGL